MVAPDARFISTNAVPNAANPLHGTFVGVEGAKQFFGGFAELPEPGDFHVTASFGTAMHAALYRTPRHKVRRAGKDFVSDWALVCEVEDGRTGLYHFYEDTEAFANAMT